MTARERIEELKAKMIEANKHDSITNEDGSLWFCIGVRSQLEVFDWCLSILAEDERKTCEHCGLYGGGWRRASIRGASVVGTGECRLVRDRLPHPNREYYPPPDATCDDWKAKGDDDGKDEA